MKKYILGAVLSLGILVSPLFASAAGLSSAQIQAILSLLSSFGADSATIANVNVALTGGTPTTTGRSFCHNFSSDLTVGNGGDDVSALNQALTLSGIDTTGNAASFTENTAGDVVSFQARYGIRQTGYVGPITRGKLNALYRCGSNQQPVQPAPVQPTNPTVSTPVITGLSTPASAITPGTKIVVSGYNFDSNSLIELDGNQALGITPVSYSPTSLVFVLPTSWGVGTHSVRVVQMKVSNVMSNSVTFTVVAAQQTSGATSGLTSAQIQSVLSLLSLFGANSTTIANVTTVLNGGTITSPTSSNLTSTQVQSILSLLSSFGANGTTIANVNAVLISGTSTITPTISYISPMSAKVGDTVTIYGSNFDSGSYVLVPDVMSINPTSYTSSSLTFVIPSGFTPGTPVIKVSEKASNLSSNGIFLTVTAQQSTVSQPTIHLSGSSGSQVSDSSISVGIGGTFTISGMPQNLQGMSYYYGGGSPPSGYYNRAFFFDQNFGNNNSCGTNDGSSTGVWTITCTAKVSGSSTFYVEIYANGQTYRSNQVTVTIPNGMG